MDITARRPGPSVQEVLAADTNPAPEMMLSESPADGLGNEDVSADRYFSQGWHKREIEQVWRKCWHMARRRMPIWPDIADRRAHQPVDVCFPAAFPRRSLTP